jgi:hypothetical protein
MSDFWLHQAVQMLYVIEYQTFFSQSVLGDGNVASSYSAGSAVQTDSPHSVAGKSNSLGNYSTNSTTGASSGTRDTAFMSYRGIENFYGNCWSWVDGFNINNNVAYVSNVTASFSDDTATGYTQIATLPAADGWQATLQSIDNAFLPATVGAGSTTGLTDYYWQASGWRVAGFSGSADLGALCGAFCWGLNSVSAYRVRAVGSRLAY